MSTRELEIVIAGLVPAIPIMGALCLVNRDGRNKSGHDKPTFSNAT